MLCLQVTSYEFKIYSKKTGLLFNFTSRINLVRSKVPFCQSVVRIILWSSPSIYDLKETLIKKFFIIYKLDCQTY